MWYDKTPTFEEYIKKHSLDELFENTEAANDKATQNLIYDQYYNYSICTDNENDFAKYFKRRINLSYSRYKDQLRIMTVSGNMDPFINHYMETIASNERNGSSEISNKIKTDGTTSSTNAASGSNEVVRTPDLINTIEDNHSNNTSNTRTDDLQGDTKANAFNIAYPEANMENIPVSLDEAPSINYANSQQYSLGKTTNTGTQTVVGSDEGNSSSTSTSKGTEKTTQKSSDNSKQDGTSSSISVNEGKGSTNETSNDARREKGRSEAIQDMLPRAIKAIRGCNAITWLLDELLVCFDNID